MVLPEHAKAVQIASETLDPDNMAGYSVTFAVATRMYAHTRIKAIDEEHCKQLIRQIDLSDGSEALVEYDWHLDEEDLIVNGDQVAYLDHTGEDIDMRSPGWPNSQDCVELVRRMAAIANDELLSIVDQLAEVTKLFEEARDACRLNPVQPEKEDQHE